jgi:hypothetical protein
VWVAARWGVSRGLKPWESVYKFAVCLYVAGCIAILVFATSFGLRAERALHGPAKTCQCVCQ